MLGRFGWHEDRAGLVERTLQDSSKVEPLLPGDLGGADSERQVVDEDRGRRRARAPERRARPVRVKDGVALEQRLDRGKPPKLERELVAIRREDRLAVEISQR